MNEKERDEVSLIWVSGKRFARRPLPGTCAAEWDGQTNACNSGALQCLSSDSGVAEVSSRWRRRYVGMIQSGTKKCCSHILNVFSPRRGPFSKIEWPPVLMWYLRKECVEPYLQSSRHLCSFDLGSEALPLFYNLLPSFLSNFVVCVKDTTTRYFPWPKMEDNIKMKNK